MKISDTSYFTNPPFLWEKSKLPLFLKISKLRRVPTKKFQSDILIGHSFLIYTNHAQANTSPRLSIFLTAFLSTSPSLLCLLLQTMLALTIFHTLFSYSQRRP